MHIGHPHLTSSVCPWMITSESFSRDLRLDAQCFTLSSPAFSCSHSYHLPVQKESNRKMFTFPAHHSIPVLALFLCTTSSPKWSTTTWITWSSFRKLNLSVNLPFQEVFFLFDFILQSLPKNWFLVPSMRVGGLN